MVKRYKQHQETTNSIDVGHWGRKITKNCRREIKVSRKNNDEGKKIIERHCSKRINRNLLTRHHDREDNAIQITIKNEDRRKNGTKRKRNLL